VTRPATTAEPGASEVTAGADGYLQRLGRRMQQTRTALCLGVDPQADLVPASLGREVEGIERLARMVIESCAPFATAIKLNAAFFEAFGSRGLAALERVRALVPAEIPVIVDVKRGDIGSTSERHAVALFDVLGADAVTASPYLGVDALEPLLTRADRFVYVLCRTSNPGAAELQGLEVTEDVPAELPREALYLRVARRARAWNQRFGTVGLVVGATAPEEIGRVREIAPELPFLVPGAGAQGGDVPVTMRDGPAVAGPLGAFPGGGLLVNVSRGIAGAAATSDDPEAAMAAAARDWSKRLRC
jgi:orotidine-5'-phosphate decarboxylase